MRRLRAEIDVRFGEKIFDVPETERVLHVQQRRQANRGRVSFLRLRTGAPRFFQAPAA
jgi:hypothetical protein